MVYRIIDKETKLFKRDDIVWDSETEQAVSVKCPQGFKQPQWVEPVIENEKVITEGYWREYLGQ